MKLKPGIPGLIFFTLLGIAQIAQTLYVTGYEKGFLGILVGLFAIGYGIFRYYFLIK